MNGPYRSRIGLGVCVGLALLTAIPASVAQTTQPAEPADSAGTAAPERDLAPIRYRERLTGDWDGARKKLDEVGIRLDLYYQHQIQNNFRGGLDTHNAHRMTGSYDGILRLNFDKMDLIPNTGFYLKFKGTWSEANAAGINWDKVGASDAADVNADGSNDHAIFVDKWGFWHRLFDSRLEIRLGDLQTNKDLFDVSLYANNEDTDFLNQLSTRNATIPHRTGIGAFVRYTPRESFYVQAAAIDAQSKARTTGFNTAFHDEDWFIGMWEVGWTPKFDSKKGPLGGRCRAGLWYDPTPREVFKKNVFRTGEPKTDNSNVGFYVGLDQMVWKENEDPGDSQGLGIFCRYGFADEDDTVISDYWGVGASYTGPISGRDRDVAGFAVSQAIYSKEYRRYENALADRETVYEWYYKCYLTPWLVLTPDLQVVTNPGGNKDARDSIVGGVRLRVSF